MSIKATLDKRAESSCELCSSNNDLSEYEVSESGNDPSSDNHALLCQKCIDELDKESLDENHWRCLNTSMWSEYLPVQVLVYRTLSRLKGANWASELQDQMYLEEDAINWAKRGLQSNLVVKDSNGARLNPGDSVVLIKDLDVKGAGFTAKRGTKVTSIRLTDDPGYIEGRVDGQMIVLKVEFLKKS